eukprot:scaffold36968_cov58-Skeletonema_marinoi.AAC.1
MAIAPLLPRVSTSVPAATAPQGPPTANTDTAIDHSRVECPENTTDDGEFITPVLYPTRN